MDSVFWRRLGMLTLILAGVWLGVKFLLPIALPFALGLMFALLAEPGVKFLCNRLRFPRAAASALTVSTGFIMIFALVWLLGAVAYRELTVLASGLPSFFEQVSGTVSNVRDWALNMVSRAPDGISQGMMRIVTDFFANGDMLLEKAASGALGMAGNIMGGIPGGALLIATAIISSFMISAQLPSLKERLRGRLSRQRLQKWVHALHRVKGAAGGWLKAQVKLSGVTLLIVGAGFLLLRVGNPLFWAIITAVVDAVPMLGTGTILIPWCLWCFVQGDSVRALGLLGLYVTAMMTRSVLEPKLVGRQLGLNPLLTLLTLYAGYQLWGIPGMIFAPILTVTVRQLTTIRE